MLGFEIHVFMLSLVASLLCSYISACLVNLFLWLLGFNVIGHPQLNKFSVPQHLREPPQHSMEHNHTDQETFFSLFLFLVS